MNKLNFLYHANEATTKIMKINKLMTGTSDLEGGLLFDVYCCVFDMVKEYLADIIEEGTSDDDVNDFVTKIIHSEKCEVVNICNYTRL